MSLALFHEVISRKIETLFCKQNLSLFKRADLGKYLGILDIRHNFKVLEWYFVARASVKIGRGWYPLP